MSLHSRANDRKLDCESLVVLLGSAWTAGSGPLYRRLADRMDELIAAAELRNGVVLPPERAIASAVGVSRSTVVATLDLLRQRGSVVRRQGSGTRVVGPPPPNSDATSFNSRSLAERGDDVIDLTKAVPDRLPQVEEEYRRQAIDGSGFDECVDPEGMPALRQAIAARYTSQGLPTTWQEIMITSGAQQAISLAVRVLCRPGDVVLAESTTWPGLTDNVRRAGGKCYGVAMDRHGLDTDELRSAVERLRPAAIALNPHHHNPTSTRLAPYRRREVARIAADYGVPVLEDRVAAPLAFDGVVERPIAADRPDAPILTADSLCKVVWPGLRMGWLRAPAAFMAELRLAKMVEDLYTATLSQTLSLRLLDRIDELTAQRVVQLEDRVDLALRAVATHLPDWEVVPPPGGLLLWAGLPRAASRLLVQHAPSCGVQIAGPDAFSVNAPVEDHIRIPVTLQPALLEEGIRRLGAAWDSLDPDGALPPATVSGV